MVNTYSCVKISLSVFSIVNNTFILTLNYAGIIESLQSLKCFLTLGISLDIPLMILPVKWQMYVIFEKKSFADSISSE